jgi:hypothetical protein
MAIDRVRSLVVEPKDDDAWSSENTKRQNVSEVQIEGH